MWKAIKKFFFDLFTDIRGMVDEKRFWGNILIGSGVVYPFVNKPDMSIWVVAGGFIGFGVVILGIAANADSKIGNIPVDNPIVNAVTTVINTVEQKQ